MPPAPSGAIVGALACQKDSYLRSLDCEVISCEKWKPEKDHDHEHGNGTVNGKGNTALPAKKKGKSRGLEQAEMNDDEVWLVECTDSVLFPEGGGQPSDHGSIRVDLESDAAPEIPIQYVQRLGLRCVIHSPVFIAPGTRVRQQIDHARRWDHMQQHTAQHLLSAIMDTYDGLATLGWGMGGHDGREMNYVELPRKPTEQEMRRIEKTCNEYVRENLSIRVDTPEAAVSATLPDDYDQGRGVVRYINIEGLDRNPCCGTHLCQTSHISLILLHHTQPIRSTNYRLFFTAGDRAIEKASAAVNGIRLVAAQLSSSTVPEDVFAASKRTCEAGAEVKKRERRLLMDVAQFEGRDAARKLGSERKRAWVYRADAGLEYMNAVVKEAEGHLQGDALLVVATGGVGEAGAILAVGGAGQTDAFIARMKRLLPDARGGGRGGRWQGKIPRWERGQITALESMVEEH